jgi:catechol-2,3-dioxygenase
MTSLLTLSGVEHAGIHAPDPAALACFYEEVLGLHLIGGNGSDSPTDATVLLATRSQRDRHELAVFAASQKRHVAFGVPSLADLRAWAVRLQGFGLPIRAIWTHGVSLSFYVDDPEGNLLELCWSTGLACSQYPPISEPLDLSAPEQTLLAEAARLARRAGPPPAAHHRTESVSLLGVGHVALSSPDPAQLAGFYHEVLGMQIVDERGPDGVFGPSVLLSGRPEEEHHEIAIFSRPELAHTAFKVAALADLRTLYREIEARGVSMIGSFTFGVSLAFFFQDPAGNPIEIYWPTGVSRTLPGIRPIDLRASPEALLLAAGGWPAVAAPRSQGVQT